MADQVVLIIDGLDISRYIAEDGLSFSGNDIDSAQSGRNTMDALMRRYVIAEKTKLQISCLDLPDAVARQLFPRLRKRFFEATYRDPEGLKTKVFYSNNRKGTLKVVRPSGQEIWTNVSFPLIER